MIEAVTWGSRMEEIRAGPEHDPLALKEVRGEKAAS